MTTASDMTLLALDGIDFSDYAVRGLTMTVAPIPTQDGLMRTISGTLVDVTASQFRKRTAQIQCADVEAPDFSDVWQGTAVTVTCVPGIGAEGGDTTGQLTMSMMVDSWSVARDEWGCVSSWQLNLIEV